MPPIVVLTVPGVGVLVMSWCNACGVIVIDPCRKANGGCAHRCANYGGRPVCHCYPGYRLLDDGKKCEGRSRGVIAPVCIGHHDYMIG